MTHFVYITDECWEEVKKASAKADVESFKRRVEKQHSPLSLFHPFPPPFIVKKKLGSYQGRLIASEDTVNVEGNEYDVIVFLTYMTRGHKDYQNFHRNPSEEGNQYLNRINKQKIAEYIADKLKKDPPKELEPLSQAQKNYLYGGGINHFYDDTMICESMEWVDAIRHPDYIHWLAGIRNTLFKNLREERGKGWQEIVIDGTTDWKILLSYFPQQKKYFLVGIDRENKGRFDELRKKYADLLSEDDNHVNTKPEILTQKIRRMYPEMALLEDEGNFWIEIQKNPQGNIALSEEEVEILNDINDKPFPLFINGRAGSGKSTVLQYLFTDYLCRYLSSEGIEEPPVYFTCNAALLNTAKKLVHSLFKCNMGVVEKKGQASKEKKSTDELLKDSFHEGCVKL